VTKSAADLFLDLAAVCAVGLEATVTVRRRIDDFLPFVAADTFVSAATKSAPDIFLDAAICATGRPTALAVRPRIDRAGRFRML